MIAQGKRVCERRPGLTPNRIPLSPSDGERARVKGSAPCRARETNRTLVTDRSMRKSQETLICYRCYRSNTTSEGEFNRLFGSGQGVPNQDSVSTQKR